MWNPMSVMSLLWYWERENPSSILDLESSFVCQTRRGWLTTWFVYFFTFLQTTTSSSSYTFVNPGFLVWILSGLLLSALNKSRAAHNPSPHPRLCFSNCDISHRHLLKVVRTAAQCWSPTHALSSRLALPRPSPPGEFSATKLRICINLNQP